MLNALQLFRIIRRAGCSVGLLLALSACGESLSRLKQDINRLEQSISDVRGFQAEHTAQISELRSELRVVNGRLDEIQHSQTSSIGTDLSALKQDLSSIKRRVPPPPIVPADALEADETFVSNLPPDVAKLFGDALLEIRQANFSTSIPMLRSALDISYGRDWSANILFWLGVSYDGTDDNRNALASYNEVVSRFSRHERAPLALLRQSAVFVRLGDVQSAKLTLRKLVADYPKSKVVGTAKEKLKNL
ncbi:MAG: tetratricopeptide repeat protein [Deltaproteobacteria bacterium]|nr:tetratricopeptide repeat protein [Deltaproteobacteria bacterium]